MVGWVCYLLATTYMCCSLGGWVGGLQASVPALFGFSCWKQSSTLGVRMRSWALNKAVELASSAAFVFSCSLKIRAALCCCCEARSDSTLSSSCGVICTTTSAMFVTYRAWQINRCFSFFSFWPWADCNYKQDKERMSTPNNTTWKRFITVRVF